eukprot:TRINITY_DN5401_c0_g1_i2.p1 TRINITY_DN5401_c0_g1~~TRINITY_DN5401_c0_g1_i2.p1  ORF type:complete len:173 (+),score=56.08 TRINITY_DN5401_c0_g1_i2:281-799(+)
MKEKLVPGCGGCVYSGKTIRHCPQCIRQKKMPAVVQYFDESSQMTKSVSLNKQRNWERLEEIQKESNEKEEEEEDFTDKEECEDSKAEHKKEEKVTVKYCLHGSDQLSKPAPSSYVVSVPWGGLPPNAKRDAPECLVKHNFSEFEKKSKNKSKGVRSKVVARDLLHTTATNY